MTQTQNNNVAFTNEFGFISDNPDLVKQYYRGHHLDELMKAEVERSMVNYDEQQYRKAEEALHQKFDEEFKKFKNLFLLNDGSDGVDFGYLECDPGLSYKYLQEKLGPVPSLSSESYETITKNWNFNNIIDIIAQKTSYIIYKDIYIQPDSITIDEVGNIHYKNGESREDIYLEGTIEYGEIAHSTHTKPFDNTIKKEVLKIIGFGNRFNYLSLKNVTIGKEKAPYTKIILAALEDTPDEIWLFESKLSHSWGGKVRLEPRKLTDEERQQFLNAWANYSGRWWKNTYTLNDQIMGQVGAMF